MEQGDIVPALQRLDVFALLSKSQIDNLLKYAEPMKLPGGSILVHENQPGAASYFIRSGQIERLPIDGIFQSDFYGPGVLVGEMAMLTEHVYSATVRAVSQVEVLCFQRDRIYQLFADHPDIGDVFLETIRVRLERLGAEHSASTNDQDSKRAHHSSSPHHQGYLN